MKSKILCLTFMLMAVLLAPGLSLAGSSDEENPVNTKTSKLTLGCFLQTQYRYIDAPTDTSRLLLRRARLILGSKLTKNVGIKLQIECGMQKINLEDAYINVNLDFLEFFIGQHYVPFSREATNSAALLQMAERSLTSEFAPFRQVGLGVKSLLWNKKVELSAGIYNGSLSASALAGLANNRLAKVKIYDVDIADSTGNNKFMMGGRIDLYPLGYMPKTQSSLGKIEKPLMGLGFNFYSSDDSPDAGYTPASTILKKTWGYGGDFAFVYKKFSVLFEYIHREISWWNTAGTENTAPQFTYTVQGGFMIIPDHFEIAARYEFCEFDENGLLKGPVGELSDSWTTVGVNYFLDGHHMKIQFNYILKKEEMPTDLPQPDNDTALVQFAYYF